MLIKKIILENSARKCYLGSNDKYKKFDKN